MRRVSAHLEVGDLGQTRVEAPLKLAMLSQMLKEHQQKQVVKKDDIERKRNETLVAANNLTSCLVDHLNEGLVPHFSFTPLISSHVLSSRVAQAYLNQRKLDSEVKQVSAPESHCHFHLKHSFHSPAPSECQSAGQKRIPVAHFDGQPE